MVEDWPPYQTMLTVGSIGECQPHMVPCCAETLHKHSHISSI